MPSPSAMPVWLSPFALRMRLIRGPAKIFCSGIGFYSFLQNDGVAVSLQDLQIYSLLR